MDGRDPGARGLPMEKQSGALVVDNMQSMPGVDYESMLSDLGQFGASFTPWSPRPPAAS